MGEECLRLESRWETEAEVQLPRHFAEAVSMQDVAPVGRRECRQGGLLPLLNSGKGPYLPAFGSEGQFASERSRRHRPTCVDD